MLYKCPQCGSTRLLEDVFFPAKRSVNGGRILEKSNEPITLEGVGGVTCMDCHFTSPGTVPARNKEGQYK